MAEVDLLRPSYTCSASLPLARWLFWLLETNTLDMPTIPPAESDWQTGKTLTECTQYMLEHEIACDVTFLLGETKEEVRAHKVFMISRSSVFSAMFCGPLAETQDLIPIPDIEPEVFRILLRYVYTDQAGFEADNVAGVIYAAKKYSVTGLSEACRKYLSDNIDIDNACAILHAANTSEEEVLFKNCFSYILENGEKCLQSTSFCEMNRQCVEKVIEADDLQACELSVWEALVRWAEAECERQGVDTNNENIRQAMGDLVYLVRFLGITAETVAKNVTTNSILSEREKAGILRFCLRAIDVFETFSTKPGRSTTIAVRRSTMTTVRCERLEYDHTNGWMCDTGSKNGISFTVSAPVILSGITLYGCINSHSQYTITTNIADATGSVLLSDSRKVDSSSDERTFDIIFQQKIKLKSSILYTLAVLIKGAMSGKGHRGKTSVKVGDVTVTFSNCAEINNWTNVNEAVIRQFQLRQFAILKLYVTTPAGPHARQRPEAAVTVGLFEEISALFSLQEEEGAYQFSDVVPC
ncbi:hypothetical protein ScPMuIL_004696 [Solemya velum]